MLVTRALITHHRCYLWWFDSLKMLAQLDWQVLLILEDGRIIVVRVRSAGSE